MAQFAFLVLAVVGLVFGTNAIFDDTYDVRALRYGRLGLLAFLVGVAGLATIALRACVG